MKKVPFPIKQTHPAGFVRDEDSGIISDDYDDIYHQKENGSLEKKYVFADGNKLPENWKNKREFTIAETGFGIGLNFLNTLKLWNESKKGNQHLHYISCELHPLNVTQLQEALEEFNDLKEQSEVLINHYPDCLIYGFHRIHLKNHHCTLTLIFGDCVDAFSHLKGEPDAWFPDGFAPSKNPQMWSESLFKIIAQLSKPDTTLATYSVASTIRKKLQDHGFEIKKTKGFGKKREMLTAKFTQNKKTPDKRPWAATPKSTNLNTVTILGAGIAGLSIANTFHTYGRKATLIDRQPEPCKEASGNPQAMIMPSFDLNDSAEARFYLSAFLYARRYYSERHYHSTGVYQYAFNDKQKIWQQKLLNRFDLPQMLIQQTKDGILYPSSGWLDTQGHAESVFAKIDTYLQAEIIRIELVKDIWHLYDKNGLVNTCHTLILANGINIIKLLKDSDIDYQLPLTAKHGQISYFKSNTIDTKISDNPHVQLNDGYITPQWNGEQTLGATFDHLPKELWFEPPQSDEQHWQRNICLWKDSKYFPLLNNTNSHKARAGIRATTSDHLPICGAIINQQQFVKDYQDVHHGRHWKQYPPPQPLGNLYLITGLGSRGFTSAPLLAEFLCNQIMGHPHALDKLMQKSIHPNRFIYRQLLKNKNY